MAHTPVRQSFSSVVTSSKLSQSSYVIRPTGSAAQDMSNLNDARTFFNSKGGGTLLIDGGKIKLDATPFGWNSGTGSANMPVSVIGISPDAGIEYTAPTSQMYWGGYYDARLASPVAFTSTAGFAYKIQSPNLALVRGDVFVVMSDNDVVGITPHNAGGHNYPMEIHQVKRVSGSDILFDDMIIDAMTTNQRIVKVTMIRGTRLENLRLSYTGSGTMTNPALDIRRQLGLVVQNVLCETDGPSNYIFSYCMNTRVSGFDSEGNHDWDNVPANALGYHVVVGTVNSFLFEDSQFRGVRHGFTTTAGSTSGLDRWGTPRNVRVHNVIGKSDGTSGGGSLPPFDAHAEGYGIEFDSCKAIISNPGGAANWGFQIRARNTKIKNCRVAAGGGGAAGRGATFFADGCEWIGGEIAKVWPGVTIDNGGSRVPVGCSVTGAVFRDSIGPAVFAKEADDLLIQGNSIRNCGTSTQTTSLTGDGISSQEAICLGYGGDAAAIPPKAATAPTNVRVLNNEISKWNAGTLRSIHTAGTLAADVKIAGNVALGWGSATLGLAGTNSSTMATAWTSKNIVDT